MTGGLRARRLLLAAAFLLAAPLAAAPHWTALGPFGGFAQSLTLDPTNPKALYIATYEQGNFRTLDGGVTWSPIQGLKSVANVAVDPSRPATLYAAVDSDDQILKSLDRGAHWSPAHRGLPPGQPAGLIAVDPGHPSRVYAVVGAGAGVWRSRDRGASWQPPGQGLPEGVPGLIGALAAAAQPMGTVFAGTRSGLYRSLDGGDTWRLAGTGLPPVEVVALAVAPSDPLLVWVILRDAGLYVSADGGTSWRPSAAQPPGSPVLSLAVPTRSARTIWAGTARGLFRSTDGGARWSSAGLPTDTIFQVAAGGRNVYVGLIPGPAASQPGGVLASSDEGRTWHARNRGFAGLEAGDVAVDPSDTRNLWSVLEGYGLFRSADRGAAWLLPRQPAPDGTEEPAAGVALSADGAAVYAAAGGRLWASGDQGDSWSPLLPPPGGSIGLVRTHPQEPATLYAGDRTAIYVSHDTEASWQPLTLELTCALTDLAIAPSAPTTLYAAGALLAVPDSGSNCLTKSHFALFRSTDEGLTWTWINPGLPATVEVAAVAVDPRNPRTIYAPGGTAVWRSTDGGDTWAAADLAPPAVVATVAVSPGTGTVWAGTFDARVFASHDGGATWRSVGGPQAFAINRLIPDPIDSERLYAATWGGVWVLE